MQFKKIKSTFSALFLATSCLVSVAHAGFVSPDVAVVLTGGDYGEASGSSRYSIDYTIDGSGLDVHDETGVIDGGIDANEYNTFYSNFSTTGSVELSFANSVNLDTFYLWQPIHQNESYSIKRGVRDFTLEFFSGGTSLGVTPTLTAPSYQTYQGLYSALTFGGFAFSDVTSVILNVTSNHGDASFWSINELGFNQFGVSSISTSASNASNVPVSSNFALIALVLAGFSFRRVNR